MIGALIAAGGLLVGKFLFIDSLLSGIVSNGVVPPIQVADILWVSPILLMVGAGIAAVTATSPSASTCGCRSRRLTSRCSMVALLQLDWSKATMLQSGHGQPRSGSRRLGG